MISLAVIRHRLSLYRWVSRHPLRIAAALFLPLVWATQPLLIDAQTTGEPSVYDSSGGAVASPISLDAKRYQSPGDDMCTAIAKACGSNSAIPNGTTIDARAFSGNQVCRAGNVTTMLNNCATNGGKLLLGMVNIYADGPPSGNYTDGHNSGIGTPAFLIPNKFWGIEGVSRGASVPGGATTGPGTWLSVCTGNGVPVGSSLPNLAQSLNWFLEPVKLKGFAVSGGTEIWRAQCAEC